MHYLWRSWPVQNNSKYTETSFSPISRYSFVLQVAQGPRSPKLAIFVRTTTTDGQTNCFTPCACTRGKNLKNVCIPLCQKFHGCTSTQCTHASYTSVPHHLSAFIHDSTYNVNWQAMARVWRDGQPRKVHIYRLITTVSSKSMCFIPPPKKSTITIPMLE